MTYAPTSPVFNKARANQAAFQSVLAKRGSPAVIESSAIYEALTAYGVDPAVFLGQFAAESSYGTAGYAVMTKSPGNIVISQPLLPHWTTAFGGRPWKAPNGRTYVKFSTWRNGTRAYVALMRTYKARGWATTIATMASHWLGMKDATRSGYVRNIVTHADLVPTGSTPAPAPSPAPRVDYSTEIAALDRYIENLEAKLAEYRARRKEYLQRGTVTPAPVDPPPAPPPAPPAPAHPPIPLTPTPAPSLIGPLPTLPETRPILGNHSGIAVGTSGPVFVFIHGGPQPLASTEVQWRLLSEIPQRLAARGARAYAIDYDSDTWRTAVEDVIAGVASVWALVGTSPITVVAHSFGGLPASIAVLRDGVGDALVMVAAISSAEGAPQHHADGAPDPVELAALRPRLPVTVVRGKTDLIASLDRKEAFIAALHAAGHPGLNVIGAGGHETLTTDATLDAIFATSELITG